MHLCLPVLILWPSLALAADASRARPAFALIIGNNASPETVQRQYESLRFADDDALRYTLLLQRAGVRTWTLAVPDGDNEPWWDLVGGATAPSRESVYAAMEVIKSEIQAALREGAQPEVYFIFAGHGAPRTSDDPESSVGGELKMDTLPPSGIVLALPGGDMDREWLFDLFSGLEDIPLHIVIDACHASGIFGRGDEGTLKRAVGRPVTRGELLALRFPIHRRFPRAGVILAAKSGRTTEESPTLRSGIVTHEIISGWAGLADQDRSGVIEYREMRAYFKAVNLNAGDVEPSIVVIEPQTPGYDPVLRWTLSSTPRLEGSFARLGRFRIRLCESEGECAQSSPDDPLLPWAEGNIEIGFWPYLMLPSSPRLNVALEAAGWKYASSAINFIPGAGRLNEWVDAVAPGAAPRGDLEALVFQKPTGPEFMTIFEKGRREGHEEILDRAILEVTEHGREGLASDVRTGVSMASWVLAGTALVASGVQVGLAVDAYQTHQAEDRALAAREAQDRFNGHVIGASISGGLALGFSLLGHLMRPREALDEAELKRRVVQPFN